MARAARHVERIAGVTEKVLPHLEAMQPAGILKQVHEIEKYDRMARRNFGLRDDHPVGGSIALNILTGSAQVLVQKPAESTFN